MESARRASEIHKRRTGRSLRVTEQDVVNEEMYEEEDDDLPMQYRRLTAHLQTGSADFNRRLAAYLTNHVAMRSALDQAITNSYAQQYPNAPQFAHNQQSQFPSPLTIPAPAHHESGQTGVLPQQAQLSPHPYRSSPYPVSGTPGYRQQPHNRSASIATPHELPGFTQNFTTSPIESKIKTENRRMSVSGPVASPNTHRGTSLPKQASSPGMVSASTPPKDTNKDAANMQSMQPPPPQNQASGVSRNMDLGPFDMSLPMESQMMLGNTLNPNDPLTSMFMAGSENMTQPFFGNYQSMSKQSNFHPSYDGMSATLAPSALDMYTDESSNGTNLYNDQKSKFSYSNQFENLKPFEFTRSNSSMGSGTVTPGNDGGWDAFINDQSWSEPTT